MSRIRRAAKCSATGAVVGGIVAGVVMVIVMVDTSVASPSLRRFVEGVTILGAGGAIGGGVCGAGIGLFGDRKAIVVAVGVVGGLGGFCLTTASLLVYASSPWPAPQPYPGAESTASGVGAVGSWGLVRSEEYTVSLPMDEVERYYGEEMRRYCTGEWQFQESSECEEHCTCREAECRIRRPWMEQYFRVTLRSISESQTSASQEDLWQD
jgi:hypothetical protein